MNIRYLLSSAFCCPCFFAQIPIIDDKAATVLAIAFLVIFLWITEAIPMAATALLPLVLFPLLDIMPVKDV
ncbi:MAG: anion permease, partial [Chitinophagaceae bacterium]|nr:anion permease [Chitinophagaceae bacterium]